MPRLSASLLLYPPKVTGGRSLAGSAGYPGPSRSIPSDRHRIPVDDLLIRERTAIQTRISGDHADQAD